MKLIQSVLRGHALWPVGVLLALLLPAPAAGEDTALILVGGPADGIYHRLAQGIERRLRGRVAIRIIRKPDCTESLAWLEEDTNQVRFAFAQEDLVAEHFRTSPRTPIRVVDRISFDYLHLFVRESLHADSLSDLTGRRIWAGEEGSATRFTVGRLLDSLGMRLDNPVTYKAESKMVWPSGDLQVADYAVNELAEWFQEGRLDAALLVAPPGSQEVCRLMLQGGCSLISVNRQTRQQLDSGARAQDPFLRHIALGDLPTGTYVNQSSSITTVAIPVLLLARARTSKDKATLVRNAASDEWKSMVQESRAHEGCRMEAPRPRMEPLAASTLKLIPGIDRPDDRSASPWVTWMRPLSVLVLATAIAYALRRRLRRWARFLLRSMPEPEQIGAVHLLSLLAGTLAASMLIITSLIYAAEHEINDYFSSFWESWWSITLYIFSGLENRAPYTTFGRVLGASGLGLSWFLSVVGTGGVAGIFSRKDRKMPKLTDHYLLLNWNERGFDILAELHHEVLQQGGRTTPLIILTDETLELRQFASFADVYPRNGDPTDEAALRRANVQHARVVVILADERHGDERTIRAILQVRKLIREADREVRVVAELIDPANDAIVTELAKDFPGRLESVSGLKLRTCVLSQAALIEGITEFYIDLLSVKGGTNEVYTMPIPPTAEGWKFSDYAAFMIQRMDSGDPLLPVGVYRQVKGRAEVYTNPKEGTPGARLQRGDHLVLIAYGPPKKNALPIPPPAATAA